MRALRPTLIVVSDPPGSGKTTLAHEMSQAVRCPAICRDEINEGMARTQGAEFKGGHGDALTEPAAPLFFEVVLLIDSGVTLIAEAAFQDRLWRPGLQPLLEAAELRIIRCKVDPAISFERAATRAAADPHHVQAHGDSTLGKTLADWRHALESFEYISLIARSIDVDTTNGYKPSLDEILDFVSHA